MNEQEIIREKKSSLVTFCFILATVFFIATIVNFDDDIITIIEICCCVVSTFIAIFWNGSTIIVTNKRVSGKTIMGRRVDIPITMISSVSYFSLARTVSIASSSGRLTFCIGNVVEVADEVNKLLITMQDNASNNSSSITNQVSSADELKQYKELLDSGVITQEEFDAKKKQLLGL